MFFACVSRASLKKPHLEVSRWCLAVAIFTSNCPWIFKPFGKWISILDDLDDSWNGDGNGSFKLLFCTYSMSSLFHFHSMEMEKEETMEFLTKSLKGRLWLLVALQPTYWFRVFRHFPGTQGSGETSWLQYRDSVAIPVILLCISHDLVCLPISSNKHMWLVCCRYH